MTTNTRPKTEIVCARLDSADAILVNILAQREGITASGWIRAAIRDRLTRQHAQAMHEAEGAPRFVVAGT